MEGTYHSLAIRIQTMREIEKVKPQDVNTLVSEGTRSLRGVVHNSEVQYRHLVPAPVDWTSASTWLYKTPWITGQKMIQAHQWSKVVC